MNRVYLALSAVVAGTLGLLAFEAFPWLAVVTPDDEVVTDYFTYGSTERSTYDWTWPARGRDWVDVRASLGFVEQGFLWGTALAALGVFAHVLRPVQRAGGETLALVSGGAVVSAAVGAVGLALFAINVPELDEAMGGRGVVPLMPTLLVVGALLVALFAFAALHLARSIPVARRAFYAALQDAPVGAHVARPGGPAPAVGSGLTAPGMLDGFQPLPLARDAVLKRIVRAREHARQYAARTEGDPAMAVWLRQMSGYLDDVEQRARMTTEAGALAAIDRELETHVFSLR